MVTEMTPRHLLWLIVTAISVLLIIIVAGCGGSGEDDGPIDDQSQQPQTFEGSPSPAPDDRESSSPLLTTEACNAAFQSIGFGTLGGPDAASSDSARSQFAEDVANFADQALESVVDGNVSAHCFFEGSFEGEGFVWISMSLPGSPASGTSQALQGAMTNMGATITGGFSTGAQGGTFELVGFEDLPFDSPVGSSVGGAVYFVTTPEEQSLALVVATYAASSDTADTSSIPSLPPASPVGVPGVVSGGADSDITDKGNRSLEHELGAFLERKLGISFEPFQASTGIVNSIPGVGQVTTIIFHLGILGEMERNQAEVEQTLREFVESHGGTPDLVQTIEGSTTIIFTQLKVNGSVATGAIAVGPRDVGGTLQITES